MRGTLISTPTWFGVLQHHLLMNKTIWIELYTYQIEDAAMNSNKESKESIDQTNTTIDLQS